MSRSGAAPASATAQPLRRVRDPSPPPVPRPRERFLPPPHHGLAAARAPALLLRHARRSPPGARPRRTGTRYIATADAVSFGVAACGSDLAQPRATASSSLRVLEYPLLSGWSVRGVEKLSEGTVRDRIKMAPLRPYDPAGVERARRRVRVWGGVVAGPSGGKAAVLWQ